MCDCLSFRGPRSVCAAPRTNAIEYRAGLNWQMPDPNTFYYCRHRSMIQVIYKPDPSLTVRLSKVTCVVCVSNSNVQGAPKNFTPQGFLIIFPKRLRIFKRNFTRLLSIQTYANLQHFVQLSPTLTKLCRIKRDHPPNFYISQHVYHEFY